MEKKQIQYLTDLKLSYPICYDNIVMPPIYALNRVIPFLTTCEIGSSFLEIGCGTGIVSLFIADKHKIPVFAMDIDKSAIDICKENIKNWNLDKLVNPINLDFEKFADIDLPNFDTIFSSPPYFLELDNKNRDKRYYAKPSFFLSIIDFANSKLNKNGQIICHVNSFLTFQFFRSILLENNYMIISELLPDIIDIRDFFSMNEYILENLLHLKSKFAFESKFPHGEGKNTLQIRFNDALSVNQGFGGWIIAQKIDK